MHNEDPQGQCLNAGDGFIAVLAVGDDTERAAHVRQPSARARWWLIVAMVFALIGDSEVPVGAEPWPCPEKPVEPCFTHHGRLSSQNGIALTISLIGTTRRVGVANGVGQLRPAVQHYLLITSPDHSYIYGDFEICPLEPDTPGHLRHVCVAGAEKLVVENLAKLRPPFRLLSTWPDSKSRER